MSIAKNFLVSTKYQLIILVLLAIGLNFNTLFNDYALDDSIVMTENRLVEKGIKGIPEILSTDLYYGTSDSTSALSELRYRPFSLVVFAIEQQFFGENPVVSHLINLVLFALLIALLFRLLQAYVFQGQHHYLAFVACLLFTVHPIHTEVIANVKSRDELITFLLLVLSLISLIKHNQLHSKYRLIIELACFFIALLTRESAVTFMAVVPLALFFFFNRSIKQSLFATIPLIAVTICYLGLRFLISNNSLSSASLSVFDSPFIYASPTEAFATKVFILIKYVWLLIFPHPLSWDYGYNQIPYININSIRFIASLTILVGLASYAIFTFKKKSLYSFCILYFFATISLYSNLVVDIGTPLSERLLFQPSLAFCIVLAVFYIQIIKTKFNRFATISLLVILLLFTIKTISRNAEWKNNETLFLADVNSAPYSMRTNLFVANNYLMKAQNASNKDLKNEYIKKAILYSEKTIKICPDIPEPYVTLGSVYTLLPDYIKAAEFLLVACKLDPSSSSSKQAITMLATIYFNEGNNLYKTGNMKAAIHSYKKSLEFNPDNADAWYNLSTCYALINDNVNAEIARQFVLKLEQKFNSK